MSDFPKFEGDRWTAKRIALGILGGLVITFVLLTLIWVVQFRVDEAVQKYERAHQS